MTTGLVVSVTDELIAELESFASHPAYDESLQNLQNKVGLLLSERAELLRDAERYRHIRANGIPDPAIAMQDSYYGDLELVAPKRLDAAIDAAMQSEAKP